VIIYYAGFTNQGMFLAYIASGLIILEGVIVYANGGDCPLGGVHHKYGDEKAFFELLLPPRAAKLAIPVLGTIAVAGMVLLFI
jgi:hypothetical protein